jgi:transcriptional regulator with XRE-family HTH domain
MRIENSLNDDVILRELGMRIAQYRINSDLSQKEMAAKSGLSNTTVERIENGKISQIMGAYYRGCFL